jgi:hypothetical protein
MHKVRPSQDRRDPGPFERSTGLAYQASPATAGITADHDQSIAGAFLWSFLRRFDPDISPIESDAHLRAVHPPPRATAENRIAEPGQQQEKFIMINCMAC